MSETPMIEVVISRLKYWKGTNIRPSVYAVEIASMEIELEAIKADLASLREAVKRRDGVIEWIIQNRLPGLVECDCHGCQEQRRDCIAAKLKEGAK